MISCPSDPMMMRQLRNLAVRTPDAMTALVAVRERLPSEGTLERIRELASGDAAAGRRLVTDTGSVLTRLGELKAAVREQVIGLDQSLGRCEDQCRRPTGD
jgi:hypothetical protein